MAFIGPTSFSRRAFAPGADAPAPPPSGPVDLLWTWVAARVPFDTPGFGRDLSRNRYTPAMTGDVVVDPEGVFKEALALAGPTAQLALLGSGPSLSTAAGDFTIEFWIHREETWINGGHVLGVPGSWEFYTSEWGGVLSLTVFDENGEPGFTSDIWRNLPAEGYWHIALERFGDFFSVFVNGESYAEQIRTFQGHSSTDDFTIGATTERAAALVRLDDVRITHAARYRAQPFAPPSEPFPVRGPVYTDPVFIFQAGVGDGITGWLGSEAGRLVINRFDYPLIGCWTQGDQQLRLAVDLPDVGGDFAGATFEIEGYGALPVSDSVIYNPEGYTSFWFDFDVPRPFEEGRTYVVRLRR